MIGFGPGVASLQGIVLLALGGVAFGLQLYAFFDALRQRPAGFTAAGKQTKKIWLAILGVAVAIGFVSLSASFRVLNIFNLIATVAAVVYLVDVRPAVRGASGRGGRPGPYGSW